MSSYVNKDPKVMCVACRNRRADCFHHVKTRGSGGGDELWNLMPLCIAHHNAVHMKGTNWLAISYPGVLNWLQFKGWTMDAFLRRWTPPTVN